MMDDQMDGRCSVDVGSCGGWSGPGDLRGLPVASIELRIGCEVIYSLIAGLPDVNLHVMLDRTMVEGLETRNQN